MCNSAIHAIQPHPRVAIQYRYPTSQSNLVIPNPIDVTFNLFGTKLTYINFFSFFLRKNLEKLKCSSYLCIVIWKKKGTTMNTLLKHHAMNTLRSRYRHATVMSTMLAKWSPKWKGIEHKKRALALGVLRFYKTCLVMRWRFVVRSCLLRVGSSASRWSRYHLQP